MKKIIFGQHGIFEFLLLFLLVIKTELIQWLKISPAVLLAMSYIFILYSIITILLAVYFYMKRRRLHKERKIDFLAIGCRISFLFCSLNLLGYYYKVPFSKEPWIDTIIVCIFLSLINYLGEWINKKRSSLSKGLMP